jgi:hypothetical protein
MAACTLREENKMKHVVCVKIIKKIAKKMESIKKEIKENNKRT